MIKQRKDSKGNILKLGEYEKKNGLYEYRYKNQDEKWCSVYADSINQLRALKYIIYMKESVCIREDLRNMTLNDQFNMWIETKVHLRDSTKDNYRYTYANYIKNGLGKKYLNEITTNDIKACYNSMIVNRRIEIATLSIMQNIIFQVFQSAKDSGSILNNPADRALREFKRHKSKHSSSRKSLTIEQQYALENFLKESKKYSRWYMIIYFMLHTGLRISEVIGLRWCDIDMDGKMIYINHTIVQNNRSDSDRKLCIAKPKTEAANRGIPIDNNIKKVLQMEKKYYRDNFIKCNVNIDGYTDFVFLNRYGMLLNQSAVNRALSRITTEYNKKPIQIEGVEVILPYITSHIFRHTFATRLCEAGVNVKVMQRLLGHSDVQCTLDIYTDATQEMVYREYCEKMWKQGE